MESAIPAHLQCPRTRQRRVADDYMPPYPSFVARHAPSVTRVVMAYFGVQHRDHAASADTALKDLAASFASEGGPAHWDRSRYIDEAGFANVICAAYWDDPSALRAWFAAQGAKWTRSARAGVGTFTELVRPGVDRYETLFSRPTAREGIADARRGMSDTVHRTRLLGRRARPHPGLADRCDGAEGVPRLVRDGGRASRCSRTATCA